MLLLRNRWQPLLLAAARHVVDLVGQVSVPAFTAIELVPLPITSVDLIVAIPAVDHVLVVTLGVGVKLTFAVQEVGTRPTVEDVATGPSPEHVIAPITDQLVIARPAVHDVVSAEPSPELV